MRTFLPLLFLATIATAQGPVAPPTSGGDTTNVNPGRAQATRPIWRATLPGGTYEVAVGAIVSVSSHEFVVEPGASRVTEVNVDTSGQLAVRFYYIEAAAPVSQPLGGLGAATLDKVKSITTEVGDRTGASELWKNVRKNYPNSTHAKTIEYRVSSKASLQKILASASKAFRSGREEDITIAD